MSDLTPAKVEAMIDQAGRGRVFQRAEDLGWKYQTPPLMKSSCR